MQQDVADLRLTYITTKSKLMGVYRVFYRRFSRRSGFKNITKCSSNYRKAMKIKKEKQSHLRVIGLYLFMLLLFLYVIAKIVKIQQFDISINTSSQPRFFNVEAPRGNILVDDGSLLAVSMPLYNVYLDMV